MPGLENLTAKIMAVAEVKSDAIVDEAKHNAQAHLEQTIADTEKQCEAIIAKAEHDAARLVSMTITAKKTEIRNRILAAKQKTINNVLEKVKNRLSNMSQNEFEIFLLSYLSMIDYSEGEALMIPITYHGLDIDVLNIKLRESGKPALVLSQLNVLNGFKLVNNDVENDIGLEALIEFYRSELEYIVVEVLFGKDVVV